MLEELRARDDDDGLKRVVLHDMAVALYTGKGVAEDKEKGKQYMKESAELGYGAAMNLYGQILTQEGNLEAYDWFAKALSGGEIPAAQNLQKLYNSAVRQGSTSHVELINNKVVEVVRDNFARIEADPEKDNNAYLVLALVGLYGLGEKCALNAESGRVMLNKAVSMGDGRAIALSKHPEWIQESGTSAQKTSNPVKSVSNASSEEDPNKAIRAELEKYSTKNTIVCIILCLFQLHYFYVGRIGRGIICLLTANFFFVGMIIDLILLAAGKFKDRNGKYVCTPKRLMLESQ